MIEFKQIYRAMGRDLAAYGQVVDVGEWQSLRGRGTPQEKTIELMMPAISYLIPETMEALQFDVEPNLPWAEDHFQERVSGEPLNPGVQFANWPWYKGNVEEHKQPGQFSHTYMERYWPKYINWASDEEAQDQMFGIRYNYGDLNDVVDLLARSPFTRQAVLPVWFPEDTGAVHGERVPCSLYYHFLLRDGKLHCTYAIRSCDYFRHFKDDVYLTARLVQWVIHKLQEEMAQGHDWAVVKPGFLTMHIGSLHVFEAERKRLEDGN